MLQPAKFRQMRDTVGPFVALKVLVLGDGETRREYLPGQVISTAGLTDIQIIRLYKTRRIAHEGEDASKPIWRVPFRRSLQQVLLRRARARHGDTPPLCTVHTESPSEACPECAVVLRWMAEEEARQVADPGAPVTRSVPVAAPSPAPVQSDNPPEIVPNPSPEADPGEPAVEPVAAVPRRGRRIPAS